ncbi:hypothetical protein OG562_13185 [Streptomyces sp. NBC_01275]|uniref:hypothetical protein n=1 Tax=Streptomyces sp. NBC_01275 TaxID=2903807 RepID=UPI002254833D|nr:hypothetical protein [Streptomyces sp. NBC_01275]MCX4761911.1 hypothetical protein [Streptomyces sp. NBC_01275]
MPVSGRLVSLAVQTMLASATTRSCGYGTAPTSSSTPTGATIPYSVLYPLGITTSGPAFGDADADARVLFQVTCVASTAEQAEWMADKVRAAILGRSAKGDFVNAVVVAGCAVIGRELDKEEGVTVSGGVYSYVQRYVLTVTTLGS